MKTRTLYLAGGMSGLSFDEQTKWRKQIQNAIKFGDYDYDVKPIFFDPTEYFNFEEKRYKTEKEVMDFDLYNLRKSDIVIVNFNNPNSLGTSMEVMLANELKKPIIALNKNKQNIHPWLECCCTRICNDMRELVEYLVEFYLN